VQSQCVDGAFHEIFNETPEWAAPVFAQMQRWLVQRFPLPSAR
jgi:alpha-beta hydrolase superfamily lysophospholipase